LTQTLSKTTTNRTPEGVTSKDQWHLATGPVAASAAPVAAPAAATVTILAAAVAAPAAAVTVIATVTVIAATTSVVVVVVAIAATALGRVLLVRGVLRLIRALEPGALDGPDVSLDFRRKPLGVVWIVRRLTQRDGSRRPLGLRGELLLW
jgi:hypothetical protein